MTQSVLFIENYQTGRLEVLSDKFYAFLSKWVENTINTSIAEFSSHEIGESLDFYTKMVALLDKVLFECRRDMSISNICNNERLVNAMKSIAESKMTGGLSLEKIIFGMKVMKHCMIEIISENLTKTDSVRLICDFIKVADSAEIILTKLQHRKETYKLQSNIISLSEKLSNTGENHKKSKSLLSLTQSEHRVCEHIGKGFSTKQISVAMGVSPFTIQTHRKNIRKKLELKDKMSLYSWLKQNRM